MYLGQLYEGSEVIEKCHLEGEQFVCSEIVSKKIWENR
jgi:hypothetical protein